MFRAKVFWVILDWHDHVFSVDHETLKIFLYTPKPVDPDISFFFFVNITVNY